LPDQKSTAQLEEICVSQDLLDEVRQNPKPTVIEPPAPMPFDPAGNLL
jgi:hypothetical protein